MGGRQGESDTGQACPNDDFRRWHDQRMRELGYPPAIVAELTQAREKFLRNDMCCRGKHEHLSRL